MFQFLFYYILEKKDKKWFKRDIIVLISFLIIFVGKYWKRNVPSGVPYVHKCVVASACSSQNICVQYSSTYSIDSIGDRICSIFSVVRRVSRQNENMILDGHIVRNGPPGMKLLFDD